LSFLFISSVRALSVIASVVGIGPQRQHTEIFVPDLVLRKQT